MKKTVLYISAGIFHPSIRARRCLKDILSETANVVEAGSIEGACALSRGGFDAAVVYLHRQKISTSALSALRSFVENGGGLLAVHSATASFKKTPGWFDILGGKFVSHEEVVEFESVKCSSGIFFPPKFTVRDELYIHETKPDITVHYSTKNGSDDAPVVWTRKLGRGRVCYIEPGHLAASLKVGEVKNIITEALNWVCGG